MTEDNTFMVKDLLKDLCKDLCVVVERNSKEFERNSKELEIYKRAFELACNELVKYDCCEGLIKHKCDGDCIPHWKEYFLQKAGEENE